MSDDELFDGTFVREMLADVVGTEGLDETADYLASQGVSFEVIAHAVRRYADEPFVTAEMAGAFGAGYLQGVCKIVAASSKDADA